MGVSVTKDVEVLRDARVVADGTWRWLGLDRQEEMYRIVFAFCVQQTERSCIQKVALASPYDTFRTRIRSIIENIFRPLATLPSGNTHTTQQPPSTKGGGADSASPAAIEAYYTHLSVVFANMGLKAADVILFYDLVLDALLEVADDAQAEEIAQQQDMQGGEDVSHNGSFIEEDHSKPLPAMHADGESSFSSTPPKADSMTPQRPQRPSSSGGGSLRNKQHVRVGSSSSVMVASVDVSTINVRLARGAHRVTYNHDTINGSSRTTVSDQSNTVHGSALLGPPPTEAATSKPAPRRLVNKLRWSIKEQKAWAMLIRHTACDVTLAGLAKAEAALAFLTSTGTSLCPAFRTADGHLCNAGVQWLAEMQYATCFEPSSFIMQQLGLQNHPVIHVCDSGKPGSLPIMERRQRYVCLRQRYLYVYESDAKAYIVIDEPCSVIDMEFVKDIETRVDNSTGIDRNPMYALVIRLKNGMAHTLLFPSPIQSGSWHESISKAMVFYATNPYFDAPALTPHQPPPRQPPAAAAAPTVSTFEMGSTTDQQSSSFISPSRIARFASESLSATRGAPSLKQEPPKRFNPTTDIDFAAAFRNSFPFNAKLGDFEFFELLGAGNFGRVVRCRHKHSKSVFALKIIRKERFKGIRNVLEVRRERKVLEASDNPYIMKIHRTYQTKTRVYFLLDYLPGGELLRHTNKSPGHRFNEHFSKFVLAELACACEYMRVHDIIHRDIKGDNLVLDEHGHLILTDFGFAKHLLPGRRHKTCCGTLAYIAPEMLLNNDPEGYSFQVDWWSAGVVLFTVLTGFFPFLKSRRKDTIEAITTQALQFPQRPAVSDLPMDLCHKLLDKDPRKRYCSLAQIKAHPWYEGFNWAAVESKALPPPYHSLLLAPADPKAADPSKPADAPPAATPHDEVTLEQELKDAATVLYELAEDVRREEDIFGSFLDAQERAGSNRDDDSGDSAADSDTDDEWAEGGSDNDEEAHSEAGQLASMMSGSMTMARPRYSSSSLIR